MKKFARVFASQIFNAFFPLLILYILIQIAGREGVAQIFLILNYANIYLLFSDYSGNIHLLQAAMREGGILKNPTSGIIVDLINAFIGIKFLILGVGFLLWLFICSTIPTLKMHLIPSILSFSFIISYNLSFYWIYMSSNKEYFYVISTFVSRVLLLLILLAFIWLKFPLPWIMPLTGLLTGTINIIVFKHFCKKHGIYIKINTSCFQRAISILKSDFSLVLNSFLLMTPSIVVSVFIGFVKNTSEVVVYGLAEKIYMGFRTLLSIFVGSIYPLYFGNMALKSKKSIKILALFYFTVFTIFLSINPILRVVAEFLHIQPEQSVLFFKYITWLSVGILIISINVPLMLWLMVHNVINSVKTTRTLIIASITICCIYIYFNRVENTGLSVSKSLVFSEMIILISFISIYIKTKFFKKQLT